MEAKLFETAGENQVRCRLCAHNCLIKDGRRGLCNVRENEGGRLFSRVADRVITRHVDPIEKKPLFHFFPATRAYSLGAAGCNFRCRFCQNADIAQMPAGPRGRIAGRPIPGRRMTPEAIVQEAVSAGCKTIAYTYTEPTVFFELALETSRLAQQQGLRNVFVTNGYMSAEALEMICPYLDAANVDVKAFSEDFYKQQCSARLAPVKERLQHMKKLDIWVEVTTLVIPGLNDDPGELRALAEFIAKELGTETPWHVSRFHPCHRMTDRPATPVATLRKAREIGVRAGLKYVYTGNVPGEPSAWTCCWHCGRPLIMRRGFAVSENRLQGSRCPDCGVFIHGVGMGGAAL